MVLSCFFEPCGPNSFRRFHVFKIIPTHVHQVHTSFRLFLDTHTSRALRGAPLAVPSRGPCGIPSLVVEITLDCRCNYRDRREIAVDVAIQFPRQFTRTSIRSNFHGHPWPLPRQSCGHIWSVSLGAAMSVGCYNIALATTGKNTLSSCRADPINSERLLQCRRNCCSYLQHAVCISVCCCFLLLFLTVCNTSYGAAACHIYNDSGSGTAVSSAAGASAAVTTRIVHFHSTVYT